MMIRESENCDLRIPFTALQYEKPIRRRVSSKKPDWPLQLLRRDDAPNDGG
jgi:hypothetical protein